jgi:hypothetical protein
MATILSVIKSALRTDTIVESKKDIVVKSKDREKAKKVLEAYFKNKNIAFKSMFVKSKSQSIDVLKVDGFPGYIVFKPIIHRGAGGIGFEKELEADLINYFNGAELNQLKHSDVVAEMQKVLKLSQSSKFTVKHEGSKNQRRVLTFDGTNLNVSNSTGSTLTDITLEDPKGKPIYLSLKMSKTYYILSASIGKYFADPVNNTKLCQYLGMNGQKMGGFGKEFACITKKPNYAAAKSNIEKFLSETYGVNVILIHKKSENDVTVDNIKNTNKVVINNLDEKSYVYPEPGRKYAAIKFSAKINGHEYKVIFQFRGTTATDVGPKYLRILMERV